MVKRPSNIRQVDISRALKAARAAGLTVAGYDVTLDGTIHVKTGNEQAESTAPYNEQAEATAAYNEWESTK